MSKERISVLLIEDNAADARLIHEILKEETAARFELALAHELESGLERLDQGGIDVALLDLSLPDSQGIDTYNRLRKHSPQTPIVVLTGLRDNTVAAEILQNGGQDFLNKGILDLSVMYQSILHAIERRQPSDPPRAQLAVTSESSVREPFLTVLSQELRAPIASLMSSVSALLDQPTNEAEVLPTLAKIRLYLEQQQGLLDELVVYSRVKTTGKPSQPIVCEAALEVALANLKQSIDETCAVITHDPLPAVWADRTQMVRLFQNLICNAIKYRGEAPPRIHLAAERNNGEWVFAVSDDGIGFDAKFADRLFSIFQRRNDSDLYPGTGIGLAVCKKIVECHGGRIWAEFKPGQVCRFLFTIPDSSDSED